MFENKLQITTVENYITYMQQKLSENKIAVTY